MSVLIESECPVVDSVRAESPAAAPEEQRGAWRLLFQYGGSLLDQSLVSGTRFATSILIGTFCGAAELGIYAIGFSILMSFHALQLSLICRPFTIFGNQIEGRARQTLAGSALMQFVIFAVLLSLILGGTVMAMKWYSIESYLTPILLILAVGTPFILLREHARQYCLATMQIGTITVIDMTATTIQLAGLGCLVWTEQLSAVSAVASTAVAAGVAGLLWLWLDRDAIRVVLSGVAADVRRHWKIGRWDCASEVASTFQIYGMTWILAVLLDNAAVGIFAACMMSIQVLNPFLLGVTGLLVPKTARAYSSRGASGLHTFVRNTTVLLGLVTAVLAVVIAIRGPSILEQLYSGQGFVIPVSVVAVLVSGAVAEVIGIGPENGVWAMERHDLNFRAQLFGCIVTCVSAFLLISTFGLIGAATSFFLARLTTMIVQWMSYRTAVKALAITD